jgi:uncharacterized protein YcaQ
MHGIGRAGSDVAATRHPRGTRYPEAVGKRFEISASHLYAHVCSGAFQSVSTLDQIRVHAISHSLFRPTTLKAAIRQIGFVQADPIRSPARAQDLILRHRVKDYVATDLDRRYRSLDIEEDYLDNYGFLSRDVWQLLHPRAGSKLPELDQRVLEFVRASGPMHPNELEASFGRKRVRNAWGSYSKATKSALERLHYRGYLRIARREKGVRVYDSVPSSTPSLSPLSPNDRLQQLMLVIANLLAPIPERTMRAIATRLRRSIANAPDHRKMIRHLLNTGKIERAVVDEIGYVWPASKATREELPRRVRFLAPFDPVVWDRQRFEHLWGWSYRFEAYTPPSKRLRGYYAMPLLWGERVIGWANVSIVGQELTVDLGFSEKRPTDREFKDELESEVASFRAFLDLGRPTP